MIKDPNPPTPGDANDGTDPVTRQEQRAILDDRPCQAQLAASLIQSLGVEGAIYACQANTWDGVLDCVMAHQAGAPQDTF